MTPPLFDLNPAHVRTLQEVVRRGSFSRAAEDLHLSQPAVSPLSPPLARRLALIRRRDKPDTPALRVVLAALASLKPKPRPAPA